MTSTMYIIIGWSKPRWRAYFVLDVQEYHIVFLRAELAGCVTFFKDKISRCPAGLIISTGDNREGRSLINHGTPVYSVGSWRFEWLWALLLFGRNLRGVTCWNVVYLVAFNCSTFHEKWLLSDHSVVMWFIMKQYRNYKCISIDFIRIDYVE